MFTENFYKIMAGVFSNTTVSYKAIEGGNYNASSGTTDLLRIGYNTGTSTNSNCPSIYRPLTSPGGTGGVIFGTGNEPAKITDTKLSGDTVMTISASAVVTKSTADDGAAVLTGVYTITNNGSSPITIAEVGLIAQYSSSASTTQSYYKALLERTVLDTPVTIPANGGVGQVTYTIRMNYPTA